MTKYLFGSKLNIIHLFYIISIIPLLSIRTINEFLGGTLTSLMLIFSLFFLGIRLITIGKIKIFKQHMFYIIFCIILLLSTVNNSGFAHVGLFLSLSSYIILLFLLATDTKTMLESLALLSFIILCFSIFSIPNGINTGIYFVGGKNRLTIILIPLAFCYLVNSLYHNRKLKTIDYFIYFLNVIVCIIGSSGTGMVVGFFAILATIFFNKAIPKRMLFLIVLSTFIILVFFTNSLLNSQFWINFTNFIGKDATLTSRINVWDEAILLIRDKFILGNGSGKPIFYYDKFGYYNNVTEAHNFVLEILYTTGIFGFVMFGIFTLSSLKPLFIDRSTISNVIFLSIIILLINGISESVSGQLLTIILIFLPNIIKKDIKRRIFRELNI